MKMRFKLIPFVLSALSLLSACATVPKVKVLPQAEYLAEIAEANPYYPLLRMSGKVYHMTITGWVKSNASVVVGAPFGFRMALTDPAGRAWFAATANEETVFYAAPDKKVSKTMPLNKNALIEIGPFKVPPEDFIKNTHPGIEPSRLESGDAELIKDGIKLVNGDITEKFIFDKENRLVMTAIKRKGIPPLKLRYSYLPDGGYTVDINSLLRFEFTRVKQVDSLPDELFEPFIVP
ncbi:MAG: hypothetical protein V3S46_05680 [Nitrospinota bacterium]